VVVFIFEYDSTTDSWAEIEEIVVDDQCDDCEDVGVEVSFTDDGGLLIAYQRNDSVSYFVPQFEVLDYVMLSKGQDYIWWDDLLSEEEDNLELSQVAMSGNIMVVSTFDEFDNAIASVYTQTEDAYWEEVDEIVLPAIDDENFDYESDMEISISGTNLLISSMLLPCTAQPPAFDLGANAKIVNLTSSKSASINCCKTPHASFNKLACVVLPWSIGPCSNLPSNSYSLPST